ncbi:NAD-dependent epimerase/dehydratase family protein [Leptospira semungkisensis]|uniref:NAD-dependent epimerase/dehydratase family protein n=1 Tax=Leptospira semungkisensis TaxID=2484985 RepID=A0A4R9FMH4_9LEPT|nr:NAD(P)H-binding protein [Leptospira semungkisensis]TGJ99424.1 NAD-dependent epimerase/dehydratase family protein [Leptospira semungkisensis]
MKIVVFGATGMIGQRIVAEALSRGHEVVAVSRNVSKLTQENKNLTKKSGDILDTKFVTELANGANAVISAHGPGKDEIGNVPQIISSLLEGTHAAGDTKVYFVGGAGSLKVAPNLDLVDAPGFPDEYKEVALVHRNALHFMRDSKFTHWTYLSPAAYIYPGEKAGNYRLGNEDLVQDSQGNSKISVDDFADAMINEVENPKHLGKRFTLAY